MALPPHAAGGAQELVPITDPTDPVVQIVQGFQANTIPIVAANDQITMALFAMGLANTQVVNPERSGWIGGTEAA